MNAHRILRAAALALVAGAAVVGGGCMPGPHHAPLAWFGPEGTYEPVYYDGYVVYYDDAGRPYHYDNDAVVWISTGSPFYGVLTDYWARHRVAYERWYERDGYRYRNYRVPHEEGVYAARPAPGGFW